MEKVEVIKAIALALSALATVVTAYSTLFGRRDSIKVTRKDGKSVTLSAKGDKREGEKLLELVK